MSVLADPKLQARIDALQAQSQAQEAETGRWFMERAQKGELSWERFDETSHRYMADKLVALEPAKAEFCHLVCRALRAARVVEVGTSYGVSTLYLAAAVRENGGGTVIATEYEPAKAAAARANFQAAGFGDLIDLREGDLRETLKSLDGPVDFVLMDIWTEMVVPALELIGPRLRPGAVIVADNTVSARRGYDAFFDYLADPKNRLTHMTLPFEGGLEMCVRV
ncbi:O-methyltransferase [Phenylobacterium sp.]|uniref:O-methyltransferase n=1 Tax=Phenylobacterium sp. TaxID=1871053 RepID=UPI002DED52D1|nr:class I SAM-dependent methyltransferase [Phenylobacterium sp.]